MYGSVFFGSATSSTSGMHRMVLGYECHKINFKIRLCVLDCPNHCPIYGRAVVWAVIGDCPTGVPIGGALSAAQTTPLFVTECLTRMKENLRKHVQLVSSLAFRPTSSTAPANVAESSADSSLILGLLHAPPKIVSLLVAASTTYPITRFF